MPTHYFFFQVSFPAEFFRELRALVPFPHARPQLLLFPHLPHIRVIHLFPPCPIFTRNVLSEDVITLPSFISSVFL